MLHKKIKLPAFLFNDVLHTIFFMFIFMIAFVKTSLSGNPFAPIFALGMGFTLAWLIKS